MVEITGINLCDLPPWNSTLSSSGLFIMTIFLWQSKFTWHFNNQSISRIMSYPSTPSYARSAGKDLLLMINGKCPNSTSICNVTLVWVDTHSSQFIVAPLIESFLANSRVTKECLAPESKRTWPKRFSIRRIPITTVLESSCFSLTKHYTLSVAWGFFPAALLWLLAWPYNIRGRKLGPPLLGLVLVYIRIVFCKVSRSPACVALPYVLKCTLPRMMVIAFVTKLPAWSFTYVQWALFVLVTWQIVSFEVPFRLEGRPPWLNFLFLTP